MGAASARKIAHRIVSVENSMQISSAMEMIATVKLQAMESNYKNSRANLAELNHICASLMSQKNIEKNSFFKRNAEQPSLLLLIGSDRGLAGAYNSNLYNELRTIDGEIAVYPIGRKAFESVRKLNVHSMVDQPISIENSDFSDYHLISQNLFNQWQEEKAFSSIEILYTKYNSILEQEVHSETIFPLPATVATEKSKIALFDSDENEFIINFAQTYLFGKLYAAICESQLSEWAMRRLAMNTSKQNAEELIDQLHLSYHRLRQGSITQEITEISSTSGGHRGKKHRNRY